MIIRFWLIAAVCVASALAIFIADFTRSRRMIVRPRLRPRVTGASTVRALPGAARSRRRRRHVDDADARPCADELGVELMVAPDDGRDRRPRRPLRPVVPAPGVPETHAAFAAAGATTRRQRDRARLPTGSRTDPAGPRPMLAVTGTDGKTTTRCSRGDAGRRGRAHGRRRQHRRSLVERSSSTSTSSSSSAAASAWRAPSSSGAMPRAWLNLAPTTSTGTARRPRTRRPRPACSTNQRGDDVAIGWVDDPVVMQHLAPRPARHVRSARAAPTTTCPARALVTGPGGPIAEVAAMRRALPHDVTNALAASALVHRVGPGRGGRRRHGARRLPGPPHRIELVGEGEGVAWYNDSKATTPHAASVAIRAFDHVVLIAGGRNKGLDLTPMTADPGRRPRRRGDRRGRRDGGRLFARQTAAVVAAASMAEAVDVAGTATSRRRRRAVTGLRQLRLVRRHIEARGDDFRRLVEHRLAADQEMGPR